MIKNKCVSLFILSSIIAVISWFLLPDMVSAQISFSGEVEKSTPKLLAIMFPLFISFIGYLESLKDERKGQLIAAIAIIFGILTLFVNLVSR